MASLSIVIAARNEQRFLPEQLHAIDRQSVQPSEVVLVDDGSVDHTLAIMRAWRETRFDQKVEILTARGLGAAEAYNLGVGRASSEYVYAVSANDVVADGAFEAVAEAARRYPGASLIVGDVDDARLGWTQEVGPVDPDRLSRLLGVAGIIHGAGAVVARRVWVESGGWLPDLGPYCDCFMYHAIGCRYGLIYTPHQIARVRTEGDHFGAVTLDRDRRQPFLENFAARLMALEEPTRTRLLLSGLWSIREFSPDMAVLLKSIGALDVLSDHWRRVQSPGDAESHLEPSGLRNSLLSDPGPAPEPATGDAGDGGGYC